MKNKYLLLSNFLCILNFAQQSISSSGGDASVNGVDFTFNIGQIDYVSSNDLNSSFNQGVLQIYPISVLANSETENLQTKVYPNPFSEFVIIELSPYKKDTTYQIFDIQGRVLEKGKIDAEKYQINLSVFPSGVYLLKIDSDKSSKTYKLIKK